MTVDTEDVCRHLSVRIRGDVEVRLHAEALGCVGDVRAVALLAGALVSADVPLLPAEVGVCRFRPMPEATVLEISIPESPSRQ
jgi:hypothetical protein